MDNIMIKSLLLPLRVCFIKIFALFFFLSSSANAAVVDVFFAGGQSNATAAWHDGLTSTLNTHYDNALVVYQNHPGKWMRYWYNDLPKAGYQEDFYNDSGTGLLQSQLADILANGDTYRFSGFFWYQGESEITSAADIGLYATRFNSMLDQIQSDLSLGEFRYMIAAVEANRSLISEERIAQLEAMRTVQFGIGEQALGMSYDVAADGYNFVDKWHLDDDSARHLGIQMATAYINSVPVPAAVWLFGSGLLGLIGVARRKIS